MKRLILLTLACTLALTGVAQAATGDPVTIHVANDLGIPAATLQSWEDATVWESSYLAQYWNTPPVSFVNDASQPPFNPYATTAPTITVPTLWLEPAQYLPGANGLHDVAYTPCAFGTCPANPYMVVVPDPIDATDPTSVSFSHEVFEMLVDPAGQTLDPHGNPIEVCDEAFAVVVYHGTRLASFTTPRAFGLASAGPLIWPQRDLYVGSRPKRHRKAHHHSRSAKRSNR